MPTTLESCEKYFGTKNIYEIFDIEKTALERDIKKAYYRVALKVHPDRVDIAEKEEATEKFKILAKLNEVLTDKHRKALYDEQGIIDDDDDNFGSSWLEAFRTLFKPLTDEDINNYQKSYVGSDLEKTDIKKAYVNGKGCLNYIHDHVPFLQIEDEPRVMEMVKEWIKENEVPEFKIFTNEPKAKRDKRHKRYARESKEAAKIKEKMKKKNEENGGDDLAKQIMRRNSDRAANFDSLMDRLMEKYGNEDEGIAMKLNNSGQKKKKAAGGSAKKGNKEKNETPIKSGRVTKNRK